jgi:hypothetical protein
MSIQLKIKSKHLSLEAGVIRFEERKLLEQLKWLRNNQQPTNSLEYTYYSISNHRKLDVRRENRATFLARAYIAGKPYKTVEQSVKDTSVLECYIIPRVVAMVQRYHDRKATAENIKNWICDCSPG